MKCLSTGEVGKEEREGRRRAKGGIKGASVSGRVKRHGELLLPSSSSSSSAMNRQPSIINHQSSTTNPQGQHWWHHKLPIANPQHVKGRIE